MIHQAQQERASYEFWKHVRDRLAAADLADPDVAIQRYMDFLRDHKVPWDLVLHQGAIAAANGILVAERVPADAPQ